MDPSKENVKEVPETIKNAEIISNEEKGKVETSIPKIDEQTDDKNDTNGYLHGYIETDTDHVFVKKDKKLKSNEASENVQRKLTFVRSRNDMSYVESDDDDESKDNNQMVVVTVTRTVFPQKEVQNSTPKPDGEASTSAESKREDLPKKIFVRIKCEDTSSSEESGDKNRVTFNTLKKKKSPETPPKVLGTFEGITEYEIIQATETKPEEESNTKIDEQTDDKNDTNGYLYGYIETDTGHVFVKNNKKLKSNEAPENVQRKLTFVRSRNDISYVESDDDDESKDNNQMVVATVTRTVFPLKEVQNSTPKPDGEASTSAESPKVLGTSEGITEYEIVQATETKPEEESNTKIISEGGKLSENIMEISKPSISVDDPYDVKPKSDKSPVFAETSNDSLDEEVHILDLLMADEMLAIELGGEYRKEAEQRILAKRKLEQPGTSMKPESKKGHACKGTKRNKKE